MWVIRDGDSFNKGILSILLLNLCAQFLLFSRSMPYFKKQQPIWYLSIKRYGMVIWYCKLWQLSKMGKQGASTHLQKETLPRHFRIKWNFLLTYVVGILGITFFNLGTAWNACVIEAPPAFWPLFSIFFVRPDFTNKKLIPSNSFFRF